MTKTPPLQINGWTIYAHPLLLDQIDRLKDQVDALREKYPKDYRKKNATKRLVAIAKLILEIIPQNPLDENYRQGKTLGNEYKHWFRAKFYQQYRLFFRFQSESKVILFVWVNDERSVRAYDSKDDAYEVFKKMLKDNCPPDSWYELIEQCKESSDRLDNLKSIA